MPDGIRNRVRAGATLLDVERPGWAEMIDVAALDMGNCDRCVLGHIYGNFILAARDLSGLPRDQFDYGNLTSEQWDWAADHGFHAAGDDDDEWGNLRLVWLDEIRARQGAAESVEAPSPEAALA